MARSQKAPQQKAGGRFVGERFIVRKACAVSVLLAVTTIVHV